MKIFYGWRMAGAACGIQLMLAALLNQSFGAYVAVLSDERGWSKTALSGAAALQSVESAIMGPVLGYLLDRFGPQGMIRLGIGIFALGFIGLSQIDSLGGFYVCAGLLAIEQTLLTVDGTKQLAAIDVVVEACAVATNRFYRTVVELIAGVRHHNHW